MEFPSETLSKYRESGKAGVQATYTMAHYTDPQLAREFRNSMLSLYRLTKSGGMGYQPSPGVTSDVRGGANCGAQDWLYSWEILEFEIYLYLGEQHEVIDKGGYGYLSVILN